MSEGSWTWAEACVAPKEHVGTVNPPEQGLAVHEIYRNERAGRTFKLHRVSLDRSHALLAGFSPRDHQIVVLLRAIFPGWCHYVRYGKIKVYYSVRW